MKPALAALAVLAFALAGCTGRFDIDQTEPIRIQLEGDGETLDLARGSAEQVSVDTGGAQKVVVDVDAKSKSDNPTVVIVKVQDAVTRTVIVERRVVAQPDSTEERIDIDVRGNNNIVVVAEAEDGDATVNISARSAGGATMTETVTDTATGTATTTVADTMTTADTLTGTLTGTVTGTVTTTAGY